MKVAYGKNDLGEVVSWIVDAEELVEKAPEGTTLALAILQGYAADLIHVIQPHLALGLPVPDADRDIALKRIEAIRKCFLNDPSTGSRGADAGASASLK